jgi:hypothetical protein
MRRDLPHGIGHIGGAAVVEVDHDRSIACLIAATILG